MAADAAICRRAVQKVGDKTPITDPNTDNTDAARECTKAYDAVRQATLRMQPWNFALVRAGLAALTESPAWGYANQFNWPDEALRIVAVEDDFIGIEWRVEGRKILSDDGAPLNILYVDDVTDTALMDVAFKELFAHLLAIELVEPLAQSNTKRRALVEDLPRILDAAARSDGQEGTPLPIAEDSWIKARA